MGRKKSITASLSGKNLMEVRQGLRDLEKQMVEEAFVEAGKMILDVFQDLPEAEIFSENLNLKNKLSELGQVVGKKSTSGARKINKQIATKQQLPSLQSEEKEHQKPPKSDYQSVRFVSDISDSDL